MFEKKDYNEAFENSKLLKTLNPLGEPNFEEFLNVWRRRFNILLKSIELNLYKGLLELDSGQEKESFETFKSLARILDGDSEYEESINLKSLAMIFSLAENGKLEQRFLAKNIEICENALISMTKGHEEILKIIFPDY